MEQIAVDFGLHPMALSKWLRQAAIDEGERPGGSRVEAQGTRELCKRVRLVEQGNEVLRRAAAHLSQAGL